MFTQRPGLTVPSTVTLIETLLGQFSHENREQRERILQLIADSSTPWTVVDLPVKTYIKGPGVGYVHMLLDALKDLGVQHVTKFVLNASHFGAPLNLNRLFLVAGPRKVKAPAPKGESDVYAWDSDILYHALADMELLKVKPGLFTANPLVRKSVGHPFSDPELYRGARPVVARRDGDTYLCGTLTPAQWKGLFSLPAESPIPVEVLSPVPLLNNVLAHVMSQQDLHYEADEVQAEA